MAKLPPKQKKTKSVSREELLNLDKNDLVDKIMQLEAHNLQLKNIISKKNNDAEQISSAGVNKKQFDFKKCHLRRVLLRIVYFGWNYQGLAVQEDTTQTIEHHLFHALTKSCLIESRETSQYHRCGRTDKGVSAFGQVISISLRSKHSTDQQNIPESISSELPYCKTLNRLLPKDIRVVAWMPIPDDRPDYSARFDCKKRQYKYYFPRSNLDLAKMKEACSYIIGSKDFRNLCKMDVGNGVTEFYREIFNANIIPIDNNDKDQPTSMYCLQIEGNAFLWHQIRCIMGLLLLIGEGNEEPDVINKLLDIENNPRKPQYNMALDIPLNLFHCSYELENSSQWIYDVNELKSVITILQADWTIHSIKSTMIRDTLNQLEFEYNRLGNKEENNIYQKDKVLSYTDCLLQGVKPKVYVPLLKRETCTSLEEKIDYYTKKRKLNSA
ncbi:PREDICTED: tRNA pseudouridine(38/39) synthase [Papilio polytes]|uniref:tRNA pseudouridine(38/39) synthase n=1 Tax=Papilio polytes TaxID=76194 RepID=UPI00067623E5|nr:PREDICTED: tRNA pseudouridine(38/39) synthase [Papilio polytes]